MDINFNKDKLFDALDGCTKKNEVYKNLGINYINARIDNEIKGLYRFYGIDLIEVLKEAKFKENECPVCGNIFKCKKTESKTTCSYKCSNTHFRSVLPRPERDVCFNVYPHKCGACNETNILEIYHLDGNKNNNEEGNLIPLCPTHKQYMNTNFKVLIEDEINNFIKSAVLRR